MVDDAAARSGHIAAMREAAAHARYESRTYSAEDELLFTRAALDRRPEAILLIGPDGDVTYANRAAIALLSQKDGLRLRTSGKHAWLAFADKELQRRFDSLIEGAGGQDGSCEAAGLRITRPSSKPDYVVKLLPLGSPSAHGHRVAIFVTDPCEKHRLDTTLLESAYALTAAELRVAEGLMGDQSLGDIADALGVKESTARSQLLSLFRKTRTSRQAQLVKLLMALRIPG